MITRRFAPFFFPTKNKLLKNPRLLLLLFLFCELHPVSIFREFHPVSIFPEFLPKSVAAVFVKSRSPLAFSVVLETLKMIFCNLSLLLRCFDLVLVFLNLLHEVF